MGYKESFKIDRLFFYFCFIEIREVVIEVGYC